MTEFTDPESYINGRVLMIDKDLHWTSFDVVNKMRKDLKTCLGIKKIKVGHTGTLDPLATGLVIICTGKATKQIQHFQDLTKTYEATFRFGTTTPSFDLETEADQRYPWEHITRSALETCLEGFTGDIEQVPPIYSAKSIGGKRAYTIARKGREVELKPAHITIYKLEIQSFSMPEVSLLIHCSKGTYIRALARDIGYAMDSGAHLIALRRTKIGDYSVDEALSVKNFEKKLKHL
jgi:tRNA pseudouridine55 synthase